MDFKGFMKGPILFDRKKNVVPDCTTQGCIKKQLHNVTYNFDVIAENCHIL